MGEVVTTLEPQDRDRVAVRAGTTSRTIANYFRNPRRMKPRVRARVETALRELGLLPEAVAANDTKSGCGGVDQ